MLKVIRSAIEIGLVFILLLQGHLEAKIPVKIHPAAPTKIPMVYFKTTRCNYSEAYVYKNYSCFAKSYSRTVSTNNIYILFKKPMNDLFIRVVLYYKYGNIYREVIRAPLLDWCELMSSNNQNKLVKFYVDQSKAVNPEDVHECPYTKMVVQNKSITLIPFALQFASGDYQIVTTYSTSTNDFIGETKSIATLTTSHKENFG